MALNSEIAKLAQFLEKDFKTAQLIADRLPVGDLSSMIQALDSNNFREVNRIYQRNKDIIKNINLPDAQEVNDFFVDAMGQMETPDPAEARALTADHFGIKEEDVVALIGESREIRLSLPNYSIINEIETLAQSGDISGTRVKIMELNTWQRYMFLYCVDPDIAKYIVNIERMGENGLKGVVTESCGDSLGELRAQAIAEAMVRFFAESTKTETEQTIVTEEAIDLPESETTEPVNTVNNLINTIVSKKF